MSTVYDPSEYPPVLRDFANYKAVIQGCSPRTVNEYMLDLRSFFRYLIARREGISPGSDAFSGISLMGVDLDFLQKVDASDIYDFLFYCEREAGNAPSARARKLSAVKGLFRYYTAKRNQLPADPSANIETPRRKQALPKFLSLEESRLLLDTVRADTETKPASAVVRNYCMITLFLNCGMRLSELTGMNTTDLDRYLRSVRVVGKGNKERIIYLNDACRAALAEYLPLRESEYTASQNTKALFLSGRGERISNRAVQWTVDKYLRLAGLEYRRLSVHKLRHTAATLMYSEGGVDVRVLKEILGHEQLNTTQIYTHVSSSEIEKAMQRNPLSDEQPRRTAGGDSGDTVDDSEKAGDDSGGIDTEIKKTEQAK